MNTKYIRGIKLAKETKDTVKLYYKNTIKPKT